MSEILSQEEIDALLKGSGGAIGNKLELIAEEKEALSEIFGISMNAISDFLLSRIKEKTTIRVQDLAYADGKDSSDFPFPLLAFSAELKDSIEDKIYFLFKMDDVSKINDLLIGGDGTTPNDLEGISTDIILEVLKDVMPGIVGSISEVVQDTITSMPPQVFEAGEDNGNLKALVADKKMIKATYHLKIGNVIDSQMFGLIPNSMAKKLFKLLLGTTEEPSDESPPEYLQEAAGKTAEKKEMNKDFKRTKKPDKRDPITIKPVVFPSYDEDDDKDGGYDENIDFLLDVPLRISVELGSTAKTIKEILNFNIGSIIELNNLAEDYVDVLVNGKLIARAEVIVIDENFGVRIMELYTHNQKDLLAGD